MTDVSNNIPHYPGEKRERDEEKKKREKKIITEMDIQN